MREGKTFNRWLIVIAAIVIQMCLGAVYAFSVLVPPLESEFGWQRIETSPAFTIALLVFALSMIPAGRLQDKKGPRLIATAGGILLGLGMLLSSFTSSLPWLYVSYGIVGGLGLGLAYVTPITTCAKWFPDKKGLITGLAVFGFGAGSIVFAPLWTFLINAIEWRTTFLLTGILFTALIVPSAQILRNPPQGYKPTNWNPPASKKKVEDYEPLMMVKTIPFFMIWVSYWFGTTAGLMVIGHAKQAAIEVALLDPIQASLVVSILGLFNAFGRVLWGFAGDRFGREKVLTLLFTLCSIALFMMALIPGAISFVIGVILVGLSFGGFLALYPAVTSDYYGTKNLGVNYGIVFTAYGAGAVLGPIMAAYFKTFSGTYIPSFLVAGGLALIGVILALPIKKFSKKV
ncbi:MAG: OFA family MFS transporter [Nitrososphaeria archaeon]